MSNDFNSSLRKIASVALVIGLFFLFFAILRTVRVAIKVNGKTRKKKK